MTVHNPTCFGGPACFTGAGAGALGCAAVVCARAPTGPTASARRRHPRGSRDPEPTTVPHGLILQLEVFVARRCDGQAGRDVMANTKWTIAPRRGGRLGTASLGLGLPCRVLVTRGLPTDRRRADVRVRRGARRVGGRNDRGSADLVSRFELASLCCLLNRDPGRPALRARSHSPVTPAVGAAHFRDGCHIAPAAGVLTCHH